METRESFSPAKTKEWKGPLMCPMCLGVLMQPKTLPCRHTFCVECLKDLASRLSPASFPCPECRRDIPIPLGGVTAFPFIFNISDEVLNRAWRMALCPLHPDQVLDFYCWDCQHMACVRCRVTKHKNHDTKSSRETVRALRHQVDEDKTHLDEAVSFMTDHVVEVSRKRKHLRDTMAMLERTIRAKHASLVSAVDLCRDKLLESLSAETDDIDLHLTSDLNSRQDSLHKACQWRERLLGAFGTGSAYEVLAIAKEMGEGRGSAQMLCQLTSAAKGPTIQPVLNSEVTEDAVTELVRNYFGIWRVEISTQEVKVLNQFHCGKEGEEDIEVFCVCPFEDGSEVCVSFARRGMMEDAPCQKFDENGRRLATFKTHAGKVSIKSKGGGKASCTLRPPAGDFLTYDKSQKERVFRLHNKTVLGRADVEKIVKTSEDPFQSQATKLFTIKVGPHRAFAVDSNEKYFIVLEERDEEGTGPPDVQRKVHLYPYGHRYAVATYRPVQANCRPSDVCFWQDADGLEILVVADEGADRLHALSLRSGALRFQGFLAEDSPLIVKPTALNTDTRGRLWVALKGGQILTLSHATNRVVRL